MESWPVGLSTGCFHHTPLVECLPWIRRQGFSIIEVCSVAAHLDYHNPAQVWEAAGRIRDLGVAAYSFHSPFAEHIDVTAPEPRARERALAELLRAAEAAAILGVRYLVIHPGPEKGGFPEHERFWRMENAARVLNELASRCRQLGLKLALENQLPHLFFGRCRDLLWVLGALDSVEVGFCLDTGHAYLAGDLPTVVHKMSGHLWMLHASDNKGQRDDHLAPGEGNIAWHALLDQLARTGFKGALMLEIAGEASPQATLDKAWRGATFLREMARHVNSSPGA
ncbi:MAG TPA: sugar phosphate isomerase/epimerase [Candidatus Nitrosotenuis sp.]|nr:sugar phosphate isomerase/epimerase [Candidatus Nitrosotenuis sp.]